MSSGYCTKLGTEHCSIIRIVLCGTTFTLLKKRCQCFVDAPMLRSHRRHQQHGGATYVRSDIADPELLESATLFDTIRVGSYKMTNVYKPPPTDWTNAALPAHQHPAIYVGDFNSHHATQGYERADSNGDWLMEWSSQLKLSLVID